MNNTMSFVPVVNREDLQKKLLLAGIDGDYIGNVIKEGITASKKDGIDHGSRLKYLQIALEILDITHSKTKEEDGFEFYRGKYSDLTDGQLEEELNKRVKCLRLLPC